MAKLGDICSIKSGFAFKSEYFSTTGVPVIRISNITTNGVDVDYSVCYDDAFWIKNPNYRVGKGDILVAMSGATVGKSCINNLDVPLLLNQRVASITCDCDVTQKYVYHIINSDFFLKYIIQNSEGCAQPNISVKQLANFRLSIPDAPLRRQIVSTLDELDSIVNARKQQLSKLDELVKSRFIEMFGDPVTNPFGWRKLTVQQAIGEKIIDKPLDGNHGGKHPKTSDYVPSGIPFIMANNLVAGKVDLENCAFISRKQADSLDKGFAKDGDVLITHKGTIGRTAILHCSYPYIMLTPQVTYYRPKIGIIPEYLKAYFDTDYFQGIIGNIASVGSTRAYIGITAQQELPLIVPPMEVQEQYATFVEQIDKSKFEIQKSLEKLETLKKALMQKYFG